MAGLEWLVEAFDCDPVALCDRARLQALLDRLIDELPLHPIGEPLWHQFGGAGGITALCLLAESHFACHTFPEHGSITINLFCCKPRPDWDFRSFLSEEFGAKAVRVRRLERPYGVPVEAAAP